MAFPGKLTRNGNKLQMIVTDDNFMVMAMHDADDPLLNWANWRSIPNYLYQIRKLGNGLTPNGISFKAGCGNKGVGLELASWTGGCLAGTSLDWNPETTYYWDIQVVNGKTTISRNDIVLFSALCSVEFAPENRLVVFIGGVSYGMQSPKQVAYSNVIISKTIP